MNILVKTNHHSDYLFITEKRGQGKIYYVDGNIVTKDYGNSLYLTIKKDIKEIVQVTTENKDAIIQYYMRGYDYFADFIDDLKQWKKVIDHNEKIDRCIKAIKECIN